MRPIRVLIWIAFSFSLLAASVTCSAQSVTNATNTGLPENGVFQGSDIESVQVNNGNLHVDIPMWSAKGRGLDTSAHFVYDTKTWTYRTTCVVDPSTNSTSCFDVISPGANRILHAVGPMDFVLGYDSGSKQCNSSYFTVYSKIILYEPTGTQHHITPDPVADGPQTCWPQATTLYADDGSGWIVKKGSSGWTAAINKHGTYVGLNLQTPTVVEDTNGNELLPANSTDTLGRQISTTSYYDSSGTQRSFVVATQTISVQTHLCAAVQNITGSSGCKEYTSSAWTVPSQITLPNGQSYYFTYASNAGGEITSITLPSGAQISYTYNAGDSGGRDVATRTALVNGVSSQWTYNGLTVTDPAGNDTSYTCFTNSKREFGAPCLIAGAYSYQGSAQTGTLLLTTTTDYQPFPLTQSMYVSTWLPIRETTTWNQQNLVRKVETDWDSVTVQDGFASQTGTFTWQNPLERREYDWGTGASGALLKRTHYNYLHIQSSSYLNANIADRPTSVVVYDGSGNVKAQTTTTYDGSALTATSTAPNHDYTNFSASNLVRGNPTTISRWVNTTNTWLNTTNTYNDLGNLLSATDPANHTTNLNYTDNWANSSCIPSGVNTYGYVKTITNALGQSTQTSYYPCTGLVASIKDQNDINANRAGTSFQYDYSGRLTQKNTPDGGQTTARYNDAPPVSNTTTTLINSTQSVVTTRVFDGFGRVTQTQLNSDPDGVTYVDTTYDATGRVHSVSNPYRSTTETTYGVTSSFYDALGRTCLVVPPDGTLPTGSNCPSSQPSNTIFTTYSGATTTITDQAGNSRKSVTDALGRLTQVFEDPAGLNYETDYSYDALGNLLTVNQKGGTTDSTQWRARNFTYDSLSRLLTANNPESGTVSYTYDANGNLIYKTSPAPNQTGSATVTLTYCYDALNRLTAKAYTQQTCSNGTVPSPAATYLYDQGSYNGLTIANGIGRRTGMTDSAGSEAWSYDAMGRVATDQRITNGTTKSFPYTYNLDGSVATDWSITYTQGVAGRYTSAGNSNYALAYNVHYAPNGSLCQMNAARGNTFTHIWTFNNRFQPAQIQLYGTGHPSPAPPLCSASTDPTASVDLLYSFVDANGHNNGNVVSITSIPGGNDGDDAQNFTYDSLNRLASAQTSAINQPGWSTDTSYLQECWAEQYSYDAWGNLLSIAPSSSSSYTGCTQESGFNFTGAISAKNQITAAGYLYDAAGNLIAAPPTGTTYTYDAENHLISTGGQTYFYDGDGKRVEKASGSPLAANKTYWYGNNTAPLIETDGAGNFQYAYYYFNGILLGRLGANNWMDHYGLDALGNVRWLYGYNGAWDVSDYYPFGAERVYQSNSNNPRKFTGKERDYESGLDNFGARFDSSSMGRFMSPDPIYIEATKLADPQQLNLYSYVRNNPLNLSDPTGMLVNVNCVNAEQCAQTVTDLNNRQDAQFQVSRDDKTGQLNVVGDVDPSKLSDSERALYNAITDTSATGTITVVGKDPSFDFEKYSGPGQNTVDRSDLNALNTADRRLSGEILAHAAVESFQSATLASTEPNLSSAKIGQIAHDRARKAFGFELDRAGYQSNTTGTLVTAPSLNFRATRLNIDFSVTMKLVTPIPSVTFNPQRMPGPRDVTSVSILPPEK